LTENSNKWEVTYEKTMGQISGHSTNGLGVLDPRNHHLRIGCYWHHRGRLVANFIGGDVNDTRRKD
jgi:hypothetical protein